MPAVVPDARDAALLRGERGEVARALNDAESAHEDAARATRERLARLVASGATDRAHRVGITGPPGVGKSTLVSAMVAGLRAAKRTVAVLAVDPSSARSGGALLGDRVRMALDPADAGVFVRSLATGGELGGLSRSVPLSTLLLSAAFDVVLVETVGVGQSEALARHVVDTLVFVVQPGSGDAVQYLKAGIMEVPDVFVVNKADLEEGPRTARELASSLATLRAAGVLFEERPVRSTRAATGEGVAALLSELQAHRAELVGRGLLAARRLDGTAAWALAAFARRHGELGVARAGGSDALRQAIREGLARGGDVLSVMAGLEPEERAP